MESYRLESKLTKSGTEFEIRTANAEDTGEISSTLYVDGRPAEATSLTVADDVGKDEMLSLIKGAHNQAKGEIEALLSAFWQARQEGNCRTLCDVGAAFLCKKMYAEAVELFAAAIDIDPIYHRAYDALSQAELARGHVDQAVHNASSAVELRPTFADYRNNLGLAFMAQGDYSKAAVELKEALSINMYYADAQFSLGLLRLYAAVESESATVTSEKITQIRSCFDRAASVDSNYHPPEFDGLIRALESSDLRRAREIASMAAQSCRDTLRRKRAPLIVKTALATFQESSITLQQRLRDLERETRENPSYVDLQCELGVCYLTNAVESWAKGIKQFDLVSEMNPGLKLDASQMRELGKIIEKMRATTDMVMNRE